MNIRFLRRIQNRGIVVFFIVTATALAQQSPRDFPTPLVAKFRSIASARFSMSHAPAGFNEILEQAHKVGGIDVLRSPEFYRQVDLYLELHEQEYGDTIPPFWLFGAVKNLHDPASLPMFKRLAEKPDLRISGFAAMSVAIIAPEDDFVSDWTRRKIEESLRNDSPIPSVVFPWLPIDEVIEHCETIAADARAKLAELPDESQIADAAERQRVKERRRILQLRSMKGEKSEAERHRWLEDDEPDVVIGKLLDDVPTARRGALVDRHRALQTIRRRGLVQEFAEAARRRIDERDAARAHALLGMVDELGVAFTDEDYARLDRAAELAAEWREERRQQ